MGQPGGCRVDNPECDAKVMRMKNGIKTRLTVSVSSPEAKWLKSQAKRLGISMSEVLRRILDEQMVKETHNA